MGYAVNSAKTNDHDPAKLSKAGELADGQYSDRALRNPPSLQALKLQDVLMKNAGGKIADCRVIEVLGDHSLCATDHRHPEAEATQ